MKSFFFYFIKTALLFVSLFSILPIQASEKNGFSKELQLSSTEPRATFEKMWVDYDITEGGQRGMMLHVKFTAYDMLNMDAFLAIYFEFDDELGGWLKDSNEKYKSSDGFVAVYKSIKPLYNPALFSDLSVFMPYAELDLVEPDIYYLSMDVKLIYKEGGLIQKLTDYPFEYTKPGSNSGAPATNASATFENLWADYNITENGKSGIRIHVKCRLLNMKDIDSHLAIYFETKAGVKLKSDNTNFKSKSGQLAIYKSLKPGYDEAVYNDLQVFIPYDEFRLPAGKHDLKMDADIIFKNGDLVKHLTYYEFWIKK
ncbi:MAG TPA: hypothetical protein VI548_03550 [Chitinophagaceae bacterium]|nr:hypothetical protein [Chitinophagaceae bacterium]